MRRLAEEEVQEVAVIIFRVYVQPLAMMTQFRYLGQTMTVTDDGWTEVVGNLRKGI